MIKRKTILKDIHKQYIMYQLLKATKYLHSANVIHRDQKPSNILLNQECHMKLCDFGLARSLTHEAHENEYTNPALTEYVATRWYRAPEILLASPKYTKGVDMWSIGCILGEMLLGTPIFPGTSTFNQLERILKYIPTPSKLDVDSIHSHYGPSVIERASSGQKKSLEDLIPNISRESLDLIKRLLQFNPNKRITADEALTHPYVVNFHNAKEEIVKGYDVVPPLNDNVRLTIDEYRGKLYQLIQRKDTASSQKVVKVSASTVPDRVDFQSSKQAAQHNYSESSNNANNYRESVLLDSYQQQRSNSSYVSSYNNYEANNANYQTNYQSDDNSTTPTPPTPPIHSQSQLSSYQQQQQQYANMLVAATNGSSSSAAGYNRKKHPSDYQQTTQQQMSQNVSSSFINGVPPTYTG